MFKTLQGSPLAKAAVASALSLSMAFGPATTALASETTAVAAKDAIAAASAELTRLNQLAELSEYDLISTTVSLGQTKDMIKELDGLIAQTEKDLEAAKKNLSVLVAEDYKSGNVSLLDLLVSSVSFDDFVSRVVYANKVAERQRSTIYEVDDLFSQLTTQRNALAQAKAEQERLVAKKTESLAAATEAARAAQDYYNQLSEEVRVQVDAELKAQREEAMQASMDILNQMSANWANADASSSTAASDGAASDKSGTASDNHASAATEAAATTVAAAETSAEAQQQQQQQQQQEEAAAALAEVTATLGADAAAEIASSSSSYSDMVSRAYGLLGSGYQASGYNWTGDTSDSSFTCSGVVDYALGRESRSSSPETLYAEVGDNMTTDVSQLQEGDLVFYAYGDREVGHVAIYVGDGYVIDSIPNGGVAIRDVNYMDVVGGGSL